ncbi:LamG domain-containing protein [Endozoicomonas sp. Mp262]|uniref:LamG domain-containing protein n=1 Tax=Endozoicomonas sp. Mp262 TaxID=2919499 RepID=UPI0021D7F611
MAEQDISDLVEKVGDLTSATTELLGEVNVSKTKLDNAEKTATESAASAKTDAATATTKAAEAKTSEQNAKKSADNAAKVVTGGTATLDPEGGKIPLADAEGKIHHGWLPDQSIPFPDFWLPLNDSLQILAGEGKHDQIDVSTAQDGSKMIDLPTKSAEFSRATTATYIDKSGVLRTAGTNEPRFEKDGILIEGGSTNLLAKSRNLTGSAIVSDDPMISPDSITNAMTIRSSADPNVNSNVGLGSVKASNPTISLFVKKGTGFNIQISTRQVLGDGSIGNQGSDIVLTWNDNEPSLITTGNSQPDWVSRSEYISNGWWRVSYYMPNKDKSDIGYVFNAIYAKGYGSTDLNTTYIDRIQIEELPFSSSYILTDGSSMTRGADSLKINSPYSRQHETTIVLDFDAKPVEPYTHFIDEPRTYFYLRSGSKTGAYKVHNLDGTWMSAELVKPLTDLKGKIAISLSKNKTNFYYNGQLWGESSSVLSVVGDIRKYLSVGSGDGRAYINGHIKNLRIWNKVLTGSQISAL